MAVVTLTVSQLAKACADDDWLKRWLDGQNPSTRPRTPAGKKTVYGSIFHRVVEQFTDYLLQTTPSLDDSFPDSLSLWGIMYDRYAKEKLDSLMGRSSSLDSILHLVEALKAFCQHIDAMRRGLPQPHTWQAVFLAQEFPLNRVVLHEHGGDAVLINGRMDAVRCDANYGLHVVDYKLSHGNNMRQDMLQLCIYAAMLHQAKEGLSFQGVLEYYEPEVEQTIVSTLDLQNLFHDCVLPVLQTILENQMVIQGDNRTRVTEEKETLAQRIVTCFAAFNLEVSVIGMQEAPQLWRYRLQPGHGVKVVSLANRAADLQVNLALAAKPLIQASQGCVTIDIAKDTPDTVHWSALPSDSTPLSFPVGMGIDGKVIIGDFADANMCHALVAGVSGSGKSEWLKSLVASLLAKNTPAQLQLSIVDPKVLTFTQLKHCPHLAEPIIHDVQAAIRMLQQRLHGMDQCYQQLADEGRESLTDRMQHGEYSIPFHVIIFDEFADLILSSKQEKNEFEQLVAKIAAKGRAAGVHLVLATQRPDRTIVTGLIKANLPLKICLRVTSENNSRIILDESGGESLFGRGDLLCNRGKGIERAQSLYVANDVFEQIP